MAPSELSVKLKTLVKGGAIWVWPACAPASRLNTSRLSSHRGRKRECLPCIAGFLSRTVQLKNSRLGLGPFDSPDPAALSGQLFMQGAAEHAPDNVALSTSAMVVPGVPALIGKD